MAVDRWHFPMLNDKQRNHAFDKAIRKKVALDYDTVLDIGTGTGLLSLYARDAGAKKIYACENSSTMTEIAKNVLHENNATPVKLIPKMSTDLQIPEDIPERCVQYCFLKITIFYLNLDKNCNFNLSKYLAIEIKLHSQCNLQKFNDSNFRNIFNLFSEDISKHSKNDLFYD